MPGTCNRQKSNVEQDEYTESSGLTKELTIRHSEGSARAEDGPAAKFMDILLRCATARPQEEPSGHEQQAECFQSRRMSSAPQPKLPAHGLAEQAQSPQQISKWLSI